MPSILDGSRRAASRIIVSCAAGIRHRGDRCQVPVGRRCILGVFVGALLFVLGNGFQQRLCFVRLAGFEECERLRVTGVCCRAFRDCGDRLGQVFFCARSRRFCRRGETIFVDQRRDLVERLLLLRGLPEQPAADDGQQRDHRGNCQAQPALPPPLPLGAAIDVVGRKPD